MKRSIYFLIFLAAGSWSATVHAKAKATIACMDSRVTETTAVCSMPHAISPDDKEYPIVAGVASHMTIRGLAYASKNMESDADGICKLMGTKKHITINLDQLRQYPAWPKFSVVNASGLPRYYDEQPATGTSIYDKPVLTLIRDITCEL